MEEKKNKKIIVISIIGVVLLIAIIGTIAFFTLNAQKLKLYNSTLELGNENYIEELTKEENIYIKEGYTYLAKEYTIDINNVGTYEITFEIKGKGETTEEVKKVQVIDTTPPTVELKKDTFYIGDNINIEEIVTIKDLSQEDEIPYNEANAKIEGEFDTSKEGESTVTISTTDKNGNTGTQELKIKVENPSINLYDYIMKKVKSADSRYTDGSYENKLVFKFNRSFGNGISSEGWINFTEKAYYEYSKASTSFGTVKTADLTYFNNEYKVEKVYVDNQLYNGDISIYQSSVKSEIETIDNLLNNKNGKISLVGKTIDQLKSEIIDLRELQ